MPHTAANKPSSAAEHPAIGRLQSTLTAGRFAITAEITPPVAAGDDQLLRKAAALRPLSDAVNVTDAASARARMCALAAAAILVRSGIEPILQMTCRDRNRLALQGDLLGAAALGIRNLLFLRGDDPAAGDQPEAKPVFDLDPRALTRTAVEMRDRGQLPSGRRIEGHPRFFLGAADTPVDPPLDWAPTSLVAKMEAGAQFVQTQFCMDIGVVRRYAARLRDHGVAERLHVLIGVALPASARSARWIRDNLRGAIIPDRIIERLESAADPQAESRRICVDFLRELADIPGIAGAHIMAPLNEGAIAEAIVEAELERRPRASR
jgi:methylenetetrahydrofolate reductase (NADPH)